MPAFDPSVIIGVAAVAVAVVVPIYLYNRNAEAKRTERLRPFMVQLRGTLRAIHDPDPVLPAPIYHRVADLRGVREEIDKGGLDLLLEREAPKVKRDLDLVNEKLTAIEKRIAPQRSAPPPDYWEQFGKLLSEQGNLAELTARLNREVEEWLKGRT